MKTTMIILSVLVAGGIAHAQSPNPLTSGARFHYGIIKNYVTRAAGKMPEGDYTFRLTAGVRTSRN